MSFPLTTLFSLACYFIAKKLLSIPKQTFLGLCIALIVMFVLMFKSHGFNALATHISITGFSLVILIVTFIEMSLLEKHMIKIKSGEISSNVKSVEREYSEIFILIGIGLVAIILSLISGILIGTDLELDLIFKFIFTVFAIIIYMVTFLGIKFANLKIKYAVRGIMLSFSMVLFAYLGNSILLKTYLS